jgi:hypothetical protein
MPEKEDGMFFKALTTVVNLTFLLLSVTILVILLRNESYRSDLKNYEIALQTFQEQFRKVNDGNIHYFETRINRLSDNQDSYQNTTSSRLDILEVKVQKLEQQNKQNSRIINNNNSSAIVVNGKSELYSETKEQK